MGDLSKHILQSPHWGSFRHKTGLPVVSEIPQFQMTIHKLPKLPYTIGYIPKCPLPSTEILDKLTEIGKKYNCIFIKLEPNVVNEKSFNSQLSTLNLNLSPHPFFTRYTFHIDLTKSEEELLAQMKSKTRYNTRVAQKHNVTIRDETDNAEAFEHYITLSKETWKRQSFYGHSERYHRDMWETLKPPGIAHLLIAYYKSEPLTTWILFLYKDVLYYPYGASSSTHKNVMASSLMMWEAIRWGKSHGAKLFDLWGCLGPDPDKNNPWYGFHRFKDGFGGKLVELVQTHDLVLNPLMYQLYNIAYPIRQRLLKLPT